VGHNWFTKFLVNDGLRRTGFKHPAFEISCSLLSAQSFNLLMNKIQRMAEGSWMLADTAVGLVGRQIKNAQSYRRYTGKTVEKGPKLSFLGPVRESADGS
jgi:hypothetical protein